MRIAIDALCSGVGGARTHLEAILPHLLDLGAEHRFDVYRAATDAATFGVPGARNATWIDLPLDAFATARRIWWENATLPGWLRKSGADVAFVPTNLAPQRGKVPLVIVVHNVLPFYPELVARESPASRLRLRMLAWATARSVRRSAGTIYLSESGRSDVRRATRATAPLEAVIPHGVDPRFAALEVETARRSVRERFAIDEPWVLKVSHLYRYKRVEALIQAWSLLRRDRREPPLLVVAGAPWDAGYARELVDLARSAGVQDRVRFLGAVDRQGLEILHAGATSIAFLSVCENCPNSVLEALASAKPVVLSTHPVMRELAGDAALFVDPDHPEAVAAAFAMLDAQPSRAVALGQAARARAATFDWRRVAARTLEAIELSVAGAPR